MFEDTAKYTSPESPELTLVLIKPDALKLSLVGYLMSRLAESNTGLRLAGSKIVHVSRMLAREHYAEHSAKPFFDELVNYITGRIHWPGEEAYRRRVVAMVYGGEDSISRVRRVCGPTNPHTARDEAPGTIRALGTVVMHRDDTGKKVIDRIDNLIHASANAEDAEKEIKLWFRPHDLMPWMQSFPTETCEVHYYYCNGRLLTKHTPGALQTCLLAPGDLAWTSDIEALRAIAAGEPSPIGLQQVAAKYMINGQREA